MSDELNDKLDKMADKLDKMVDTMTVIQVSQGKMEVNVEEHIRRTGLAEENIALIRAEMEPIKEHVTQVRTITKFAMWIVGGIGALIVALIAHFKR